jgi:hypothetical protein
VTTKMQTAMATLVAAVPAGVLGYFVINSFLGGLEKLPTTYQGLYGATLAGCAAMVFLPLAVLIFGPKSPKRAAAESAKASKKKKGSDSQVVDAVDTSKPELVAEGIEEASEKPLSTGELEVVEPTASEAELDALESFGGQDESKTETFDAFTDEGSSEDIRTPEEAAEIGAKTESIQSIVFPEDDEFTFDDEVEPPPKKKKK